EPGLAIARVPARQQCTGELARGRAKADDRTGPPLAQPADHLWQGTTGRAGLWARVPLPIDPEAGVPAQRLDRGAAPVGVEAPIAQDHDGPGGGHTALYVAKERCPMRAPGARARRLDDAPGDGKRTATDDHTDEEHRKTLPQGRGIQRECEMAARGIGPRDDPAEHGGHTGRDLQRAALVAPFGPTFVGTIAIPVAEVCADRRFAAPEQLRQAGGNGRESTALGEDNPTAPQGHPGPVRQAQMWQRG